VGLFYNVTTGFTDLYEKPSQGLVKGPLEAGMGLMQGAGSLITNVMAGTLNSVSKMTGAVSSGLAELTMDREYMA
jgi:vacuolar protein sorting-associated protein 13A/C